LGAIAGVVYTALYARFSAQWSYLANVYHQIKSAIITGPNHPSEEQREQLTYWKAAFVEDAQDLHLVRKKMFAMTAWVWLQEGAVADKFDKFTTGGKPRRLRLQRKLRRELLRQDPTLQLPEVEDDEAPTSSDAAPPAVPPAVTGGQPEAESDDQPNRGS
jgi:hypothetical protein